MTSRAAANRYARALLDVSVKETDPQQVERDLAEFVALLTAHETLWKLLRNPAVPAPRKQAALAEIAKLAGLAPVVQRTVAMLAEFHPPLND